MFQIKKIYFFLSLLAAPTHTVLKITLSSEQARAIGEQVWQNESGKSTDKLVFWNAKEDFPSLGIGHFIWCPAHKSCPFKQTFPSLVWFMRLHGATPPASAVGKHCPWKNREQFVQQEQSRSSRELRHFLADTIDLQAHFMIKRLNDAVPRLLSHTGHTKQVLENLHQLAATPWGLYLLVDYLNFKGEGTSAQEAYNGHRWGLLQVLERMNCQGEPCHAFADAATTLLKARVAHPPSNEQGWLPRW